MKNLLTSRPWIAALGLACALPAALAGREPVEVRSAARQSRSEVLPASHGPSRTPAPGLLRVSTRLADGPAPGQRAGAILQWEFLRSQSQDLPRMTYRLQEMEGELATLRWLASRQREAMITLQAQVDEARTAFVGPASLVLALVLTGGWAAFLLPGARAAAGRSRSRAKGQGFPTDQVALPLPAGPFAVDIDLGPHAGALRENAHA